MLFCRADSIYMAEKVGFKVIVCCYIENKGILLTSLYVFMLL